MKKFTLQLLTAAAIMLPMTRSALADEDEATWQMTRVGQDIGWIQATCTFHKNGLLKTYYAEHTIKIVLRELAGKGSTLPQAVKRIVLRQYPSCKTIWPREFLD